jgi:chromosome segregation ATPase
MEARLLLLEKGNEQLKEDLSTTKDALMQQLTNTQAELTSTKAELNSTKAELNSIKAELNSTKAELSSTKARLTNELTSIKLKLTGKLENRMYIRHSYTRTNSY